MAESLALYVRLVSARVRAQWQYRASFALDVVGVFLVTFLDFMAILVIFDNVPQLAGWSVQEVALLYGIAGVSFSIAELAVGHLDLLPQLIRDGNFDLVLVRPRSSLLQVIVSDFRLDQFGRLLQSTVVLVYAVVALDIGWTADRVAMIVVAVLAGAAIFAAIWVAGITIVFWAVEGRESVNSFTDGGNFLSEYPIDVYAKWLQRFVTFVVPIAFVAYFPASYVLDKPDPLGAPDWVPFASPAVALVAAVGAGLHVAKCRAALPERGRLMAQIELESVEKTFVVRRKRGRVLRERTVVQAVAGISFEIEAGTLAGYIGPNGAGKSTTVKMLTGILVPSSGRISVAGFEPSRQRIQLARRIGVMFGQRMQLWWDLPLADSFELLRHIYKVPEERYRQNLGALSRAARPGRLPAGARAAALARPARARRADGRDAARPRDRPARRAHDRPRRGGEGASAGVPDRDQLRARRDRAADDARPRRHRAAVLAPARDRPRHASSTTATSTR